MILYHTIGLIDITHKCRSCKSGLKCSKRKKKKKRKRSRHILKYATSRSLASNIRPNKSLLPGMQMRRHEFSDEYSVRPRRNTLPRSHPRDEYYERENYRAYDDHADRYDQTRPEPRYYPSSALRDSKRISSSLPEGQLRQSRSQKKVVHFVEGNGRTFFDQNDYSSGGLSRARARSSYQLYEKRDIAEPNLFRRRAHSAERSFQRHSPDEFDRSLPRPHISQYLQSPFSFESQWRKANEERIKRQQKQKELQRHNEYVQQQKRILRQTLHQQHLQEQHQEELQKQRRQQEYKKQREKEINRQKFRQLQHIHQSKRRHLPKPALPHPLEQVKQNIYYSQNLPTTKRLQPRIPHPVGSQVLFPAPVHQTSLQQKVQAEQLKQQLGQLQVQQTLQQQQLHQQQLQQEQLRQSQIFQHQHHQNISKQKLEQQKLQQHKLQQQHVQNQELHQRRLHIQQLQHQHLQRQRIRQQEERNTQPEQRVDTFGNYTNESKDAHIHASLKGSSLPSQGFLSQVQEAISKRIKAPPPNTLARWSQSSFSPRNVFSNLPQVHAKLPLVQKTSSIKPYRPAHPHHTTKLSSPDFLVHSIPPVVVAPTSCRIPEGKSRRKLSTKRDKKFPQQFDPPSLRLQPETPQEQRNCLPSCDTKGDFLFNQLKDSLGLDVVHLVHDLWSAIQNLTDSISMVSEECRSLKHTLGRGLEGWTSRSDPSEQQCSIALDSTHRWDNAYSMSDGTRGRNEVSVEHVLTQMRDAGDKRRELEKQHGEALSQLHQKQAALEGALGSKLRRKECADAIETLKSKIRELEKKAEVQNLRHEELLLEMQSMKKGQSSPKNSWSRSGSLSAELQSPESGDITPDSSQILSNCSTPRSTPVPPTAVGVGLPHHAFDPLGIGSSLADSYITSLPTITTSCRTGFSSLTSTVSSSYLPSNFGLMGDTKPLTQSGGVTTSSEIDKIVAKIRQDNKLLAALDKTRTNIGIPTLATTGSSIFSDPSFISSIGRSHGLNTSSVLQNIYTTPLNSSTVTTMAALDLSQPFPSTLVNSFSNPIEGGLLDQNLSHLNLGTSLGPNSFSTYLSSLPASSLLSNTISGNSPNGLGAMGLGIHGLNLMGNSPSGLIGDSLLGPTSLPTIITTSYDKDDKNIINGNIPGVILAPNSLQTDNRILDVLEIPGKGRCHVYIARYSYDPFRQSPNENPEAELTLNAGDYVLVWGSMDEVSPRTIDGFFDGEVLDGRRGLVPSNFVEKLVGDDLIEFHQSIVMGLRECDESVSTSVPQDLDFISQDESQILMDLGLNPQDTCSYSSYLDLEDYVEDNEDPNGEQVPPPVQLTLERQLNKSIVIGWNPPSEALPGTIESYHVYVNGLLKTTVKANERTRALVEGVDSTRLHRISVRAVTPNRRTSRDAACTMIIGNDPPLGPSHVRASNTTSTSAVISWLPSNSNFQHTVCVNSVEVRTVKPGVYRHTITGLSPNTIYRVTIRARNLRAPQFHEKLNKNQERLSSSVEFRTLPKGLPEPPVDVQVEMGPQDGSLLVTWLPVTIDSNGGTSNGAPVTGYAVYADGKKITEVDSPTGDHALIDLTQIHGFEPKQITVRTKSRENVSADSVPTLIPIHFYKGGMAHHKDTLADSVKMDPRTRLDQHQGAPMQPTARGIKEKLFGRRTLAAPPGVRTDHMGQTILEHEENLSDKEVYPSQHAAAHLPTPHGIGAHNVPPQNMGPHNMGPHNMGPHNVGPHNMGPHAVGSHATGQHAQGQIDQQHQMHQQTLPPVGRGAPTARGQNRQVPKYPQPGQDHHMDEYHEEAYDARRGGRLDRPGAPPARGGHMDRGRQQPAFNRGAQRDGRDPRDLRDPHETWDSRDQSYPRDRRDPRDSRDPRDARDPRMLSETRDPRDFRDGREQRDYRDVERYEEGRSRDYSRSRGEHPRIFVALFDYDPPTMSPNPEACDEELGFREGQLIKVYGDKDPDGFYWGEASGRGGYVPGNMVSEVQVDDDRVAQELLKESETGRRRRDQSFSRRGHAGDRWGDIYANMPVRKMVALYDYDPQELSPNVDSEVELSFQTGDIIFVYGDMDDDGFFMGELRGQRGLVPSNFLQDVPTDYDDHRSRRDTLDPRDRGYGGGRGHGPGPGAHGPGPGAHGPPPPPRPDQRDRRKGYEGPTNGQPPRTPVRTRGQLHPGEKW